MLHSRCDKLDFAHLIMKSIDIPVTVFIIVMAFSAMGAIPQSEVRPMPSLILFVFILTIFISATYTENKKRFIKSTKKIEYDLERNKKSHCSNLTPLFCV
ncbi:hypothetical protein BH10BAC4_BH10BAC4_03260 [soil metagenome]